MPRLMLCAALLGLSGSALAQQVPQPVMVRSTYISVTGSDTVWQNVIRTPRSFQSDLLLNGQDAAVKVVAIIDDRALVKKLDLDVWRGIRSSHPNHLMSATYKEFRA